MKLKIKRPKPQAQPVQVPPGTCTGKTLKGAPCKLEPELGSDRCVFHPHKPGEARKK